jgi:hypothetical protein
VAVSGDTPDADRLTELLSGTSERLFDPFPVLDPLVGGHPGDGGSKGITGNVGSEFQCAFHFSDGSFETLDSRA